MAKKLNLKAIYTPEDKKLVYKEKKKAAFERNVESKGYCWTQGYIVTNCHISQTCNSPAAGYQRQASQQNIMGGSETSK